MTCQDTGSDRHGVCFGLGRKVIRTLMVTECLVIILAAFMTLKGTQSAMGPDWPGHYFRQFEKRLPLNPKSNVPFGCIKKSASILSTVSFDPRSFTENFFWANFNSSYDIILSYLNWSKTVPKGTWRELVRNAFIYQNNKRNESITLLQASK